MGEFPTEKETKNVAAMINKVNDDFPKIGDSMIDAFKESESMEAFRDRAAQYLWYGTREYLACAEKMGLTREFQDAVIGEVSYPETHHPRTVKGWKAFVNRMLHEAARAVF